MELIHRSYDEILNEIVPLLVRMHRLDVKQYQACISILQGEMRLETEERVTKALEEDED